MAEVPGVNPINSAFDKILGEAGIAPAPNITPVAPNQPGDLASETLRRLGAKPSDKQNKVNEVSRAKQIVLGGPDAQRDIAAAERGGNTLSEDPVVRDLQDMDFGSLVQKYGEDVARNRYKLIEEKQRFNSSLDAGRTAEQRIGDTLLDVGSGAAAAVGGVAGLAVGAVNENAGTAISQGASSLSQSLKGFQSSELSERRESFGRLQNQDSVDSNKIYDAIDEPTMTDVLGKFGRDVGNTFANMAQDPAMAGSLVGESAGSFAVPLALGKLGSRVAPTLSQGAVTTGAIGLTESGGVYSQAVNEVMGMSEDELSVASEAYKEMRRQGDTHEEAQRGVANDAGLLGAAVQLPLAIVAGKAVSRFQANPLKTTSLTRSLQDIGKETLEEGFQSGTGELTTDLGVKTQADKFRQVGDTVGEAVAMGAVGGAGMAATLQAPGLLRDGVVAGAKGTVRAAGRAIDGRVQSIAAAQDAASPVGSVARTEAVETAKTSLAAVVQSEPIVAESVETVEAETAQKSPMQRAKEALVMTGPEVNETPDAVKRLIAGEGEVIPDDLQVDRLDVLSGLLTEIESGNQSAQDTEAASLWLYEQAKAFEALRNEDMSSLPAEIQEMAAASQAAVDTILANPTLQKAVEQAQSASFEPGSLPEITDRNINSPEVKDALARTIQIAQSNPAGIDPKFVDSILDQRSKGKIQFSDKVMKRLEAAAAIAKEANAASEKKEAMVAETTAVIQAQPTGAGKQARKTVDIVRREILTEGKDDEAGQIGLSRHLSGIVTSLNNGDQLMAQLALDNLRNFGEHMQNKVKAARESFALGKSKNNTVPYRTWTGVAWIEANKDNAGKIGINANSPNSIQLGKEAAIDAETVSNLYNNLITIYGSELTGQALPPLREATPAPAVQENTENVADPVEVTPVETTEVVDQIEPETIVNEAEPDALELADNETRTKADFDAMTDDQLLTSVNGWEADVESLPMIPQRVQQVRDVVNPILERFNLAPSLIRRIAWLKSPEKDHLGQAYWTERVLSLKPSVLKKMIAGVDKDGIHVAYHELMHMIDAAASKTFGRTASMEQNELMVGGKIHAEVLGLVESDPEMAEYFEYALGQEDPAILASELFAEIGALMLLIDADVAKTLMPKGVAYVEETIGQAGGKIPAVEEADAGTSAPVIEDTQGLPGETEEAATQEVVQTQEQQNVAVSVEVGAESEQEVVSQEITGEQIAEESVTESVSQSTPDQDEAGTEPASDSVIAEPGRSLSFDNLAKTAKGVVRFVRAYTVDTKKSLLMQSDNPARGVLELLGSYETYRDQLALNYRMDQDQIKAWNTLIERQVGGLVNRMNASLKTKKKALSSGKLTPLEALAQDKDYTGFRETRALNLVDPEAEVYDPRLIQAAALAALHWTMNTSGSRNNSAEEVAKIFGVEEDAVTPGMMHAANSGLGANTAAESLARTIREFWGVTTNKDAPMSDTLGISQAIAAELLSVMDGHLVTKSTFELEIAETGVTADAIFIQLTNETSAEVIEQLKGTRMFLQDAFLPEAERAFYFDQTPDAVRKSQKNNPLGKLGAKMTKALRRHQDIAFMRNTPYLNMMQAIGRETFGELMGKRVIEETRMNKVDVVSIQGKNNSVDYSWNGVESHNAQLEGYADREGKNPDEVETHFDWYVVSNERIHADGFNPQSDKTMREAFVATVSTLDMTTEKGRELFWLTVAQSSDLVKTEKEARADGIDIVQEKIFEKFGDSITVMEEFLEAGGELSQAQKDVLLGELGGEGTPKILHAILSVAQYNLAVAEGGEALTSFKHNLSLEADGKTDGPINAMIHFLTGKFDASQLLNMAKGGFYPNEQGKTLNEYIKGDSVDLYETAAVLFQNELAKVQKSVMGTKAQGHMTAVNNIMNYLIKDASFNEKGELVIGRGILKNPLTVTVYGSGVKGIANKVTSAVTEVLYQKMTELEQMRVDLADPSLQLSDVPSLQNYPTLAKDLTMLTTTRVGKSRKGGKTEWYVTDKDFDKKRHPLGDINDGVNFQLSRGNMAMLSTNLQNLFVSPMNAAIKQMMGGTQSTLEVFQKATQAQSLILITRFDNAVQEVLKEKREKGELGGADFMSENDYQAVFDKMAKFGAVIAPIQNDEHHLNLSNKAASKSQDEFFRSMDNEYSGNATIPRPAEAGVKVSALLTISRGDAKMMVNYFAKESLDPTALKTLPVFDGLEMPADGIDTLSALINEAVSDAWLENPAQDMSDSFTDFMRQEKDGPLKGLERNSELLGALVKLLGVDIGVGDPISDITEEMAGINERIAIIAQSIQARKNVYKRIGYSIDHMASGENPFSKEGEVIEGDLVEGMNLMYDEELAKLKSEKDIQTSDSAIEKPLRKFRDRIREVGTEVGDDGPGLVKMDVEGVRVLMNSDLTSKDNLVLVKAVADAMPGFTFFFGSSKKLTAFRDKNFPERKGSGDIQNGQIDLLNGVIYISNQAGETVLHEMLHAALSKQLLQFYDDPSQMTETQRAAIQNLESLMAQFQTMDFAVDGLETKEAAELVQAEITKYQGQGGVIGNASAMNEFIAWTLTNQNLINALRTARVRTPLQKLVDASLKGLRKLLGLSPQQSLDIFSNIAFNTGALLVSNDVSSGETATPPGLLLNQVSGKTSDSRLRGMMYAFDRKIASHLKTRDPLKVDSEELKITDLANHAANTFMSAGFDMDAEQLSAFRNIQAAMASTMEFDNKALVRIQKIFAHVTKQLTVESFMDEPDLNGQQDRYTAQQKFNVLTGKYGVETDLEGRSNLLASFLALSQVDPQFRETLRILALPKDRNVSFDSMDEFLESAADSVLNTLATSIAGEGLGNKSTLLSLDRLTAVLSKIEADDHTLVEKKSQALLSQGDAAGAGFLSTIGERLGDFADAKTLKDRAEGRSKNREVLWGSARILASAVNANKGKAMANATVSLLNETKNIPRVVLELINETIGQTDENKVVYEMINRVKYAVSGMRQDFRETLPRILTEQFSRKLTKTEWSQLHMALGKTDIAALGETYTAEQIRKIINDPAYMTEEIEKAETEVRSQAPKVADDYIRKAQELAEFMISGKIASNNNNLLRNAEAISRLLGEDKKGMVTTKASIDAIDRLTTLYAVANLENDTLVAVNKLSATEAAGMDFVTYYLADLRRNEVKKQSTDAARLNGYKGYIPSESREGATMMVADDTEFNRLKSLGYTRLGDYQGSGFEAGKKGYYFSTVAGNNQYMQGALQTVQISAMGVDPRTGRTVTGKTAGRLANSEVGNVKRRLKAGQGARRSFGEALMPIYDSTGEVVGYERSMDPDKIASLDPNTRADEMIGAWAGRQAEEELAQEFNFMLIDRVKEVYDRDRRQGRKDEFVNLADQQNSDPVIRDAWKLVPIESREYIEDIFGEGNFPVRRDMLNNTIGYREASIGDAWVGLSRLDPKSQKLLTDTMTAVLGQNAYKYLKTAETAWQAGVSVAKNTIVIRSVIVPISNMGSNFMQLLVNGVSPRDIHKGMTTKLVEIDQHLKNLSRGVEIKANLARFRGNDTETRKLKTELKSLEDSSRRMSIWPLIEAGEFSTISEGLTEADAAIGQGKWVEWIQEKADKLPSKLGTAGRYAVISRDTALFKGMARAVQYGDFLGKAVLYDHVKKNGKASHEQALEKITEEFVNYNLLPGRTRSYAESMGLTWFWAYKIRSIKIAHRHIVNNPLRALLTTLGAPMLPDMPGMSMGSPITDNALSVIADDRLGYSVGPGMLFNAPGLNPWVNLTN